MAKFADSADLRLLIQSDNPWSYVVDTHLDETAGIRAYVQPASGQRPVSSIFGAVDVWLSL